MASQVLPFQLPLMYPNEAVGKMWDVGRDQFNSRFHSCDIFCEIGLLPLKTPSSVKSVIFREF